MPRSLPLRPPLPRVCRDSVLWVANPEETGFFIKMLLTDIYRARWGTMSQYLE